jgi:ankyrin repeat protein
MKGELPVTAAACNEWTDKDIEALHAAGGFIQSGLPVYWASFCGCSQALTAILKLGGNANEQRTYTLKYLDKELVYQKELECVYDEWPMHVAAQRDEHDCLKILAQHGANVNQIDNYGRDALQFASEHGHLSSVKVLIDSGANPTRDIEDPAWDRAVFKGRAEVLSLFLDRFEFSDDKKSSALWRSAKYGHANCAQVLLDARADVNTRRKTSEEDDYTTPLEIAAKNGHSSCVKLLQEAAQSQQARQ